MRKCTVLSRRFKGKGISEIAGGGSKGPVEDTDGEPPERELCALREVLSNPMLT